MTTDLFVEYMSKLDRKFIAEDSKVVMLIDSCPSHPRTINEKLKATKLVFFPTYSASKLQPMDQGVIKSFKARYRRKLLQCLIHQIEGKKKMASDVQINFLMAMNWSKYAWGSMSATVIRNCIYKAHFKLEDLMIMAAESETLDPAYDDMSSMIVAVGGDEEVEDYVTSDGQVIVTNPNPEDIDTEEPMIVEHTDDKDEQDDNDPPTVKEAMDTLDSFTP